MATNIHPTAIVDPSARIADNVQIGPYCIVGPNVSLGEGSVLGPHCVIDGHTLIGQNNTFYRFCSVGGMPQDKKYAGEPTRLEIGDNNMFREYVTLNTGTVQDVGVTRIGSNNWVMAYVHVAHDCQIGSHTILANGVQMGGHVHVGDWAIVGGLAAVHQFGKVGAHAMVGGSSALHMDVPPFVMGSGNPCVPVGINVEGLKRRGFAPEAIAALRDAYKTLYRRGLTLEQARLQLLASQAAEPLAKDVLQTLLDFLATSARGIIRP